MFVNTNTLAKLGVGAAHQNRVQMAERLFFPVAVDFANTAQPMQGGSVGNRNGDAVGLSTRGIGGNTGGFLAEFSGISGDPLIVMRKVTSDGIQFVVADTTGQELMVEKAGAQLRFGSLPGDVAAVPGLTAYQTVPRYQIKADGVIYDLLGITDADTGADNNADNIADNFQHWAVMNTAGTGVLGSYAQDNSVLGGQLDSYYPPGMQYTPPASNTITTANYSRPVGRISFKAKSGASSQFVQDQLSQMQSAIDGMSRLLRTLHDEAKGPFANLILR